MGVQVIHISNEKSILRAPFSPNINHKKTVFGGSLHALATLSCWCFLHANIEIAAEIVITNSQVDYLAPVVSDFQAQCLMPAAETWNRFCHTLHLKGKARIQLESTIFQDG